MLLVAAFWMSTLISELLLDQAAVLAVKRAIAHYGLVCLVLSMAVTGATGFSLGKTRKGRLVEEKKRRMPLLAVNGLVIMVPSALFLYSKAAAGQYDASFYAVQVLELVVGVVQFVMLGKNWRAGLVLSGRLRRSG